MRRLSTELDRKRYDLCVVDASAHHTVKTRFHERAVSRSRDLWIRFPLAPLARASGADFLQARIDGTDFDNRTVHTSMGPQSYDILVITLGGVTSYRNVPGAAEFTSSLQTYEDTVACSRRIEELGILDRQGPRRRVTVCGAGLEGIEVATTLRQYAPPARCRITLLERSGNIMAHSQGSDRQRRYILRHLDKNDIHLFTGAGVREVGRHHVTLDSGSRFETDLVIWCSGVEPTPLPGVPADQPFVVDRHLRSRVYPEVFATGDFARVDTDHAWSNLFSAQRALYQAEVLAENVCRAEEGRPLRGENYQPKGELISLGDFDGVGVVAGLHVQGKSAAAMKKANEARYLSQLLRHMPRTAMSRLW